MSRLHGFGFALAVAFACGCSSESGDSERAEDPITACAPALTAHASSAVEDARKAFNAAEEHAYPHPWKSVFAVHLFEGAVCGEPSLTEIEEALPIDLRETLGDHQSLEDMDRSGLQNVPMLDGPNGAALLVAVDTFGNVKDPSTIVARVSGRSVTCQDNSFDCDHVESSAVVFYRETGRVAVIEGNYGSYSEPPDLGWDGQPRP